MKCLRCLHENPAGAKFCQECVQALARLCGEAQGAEILVWQRVVGALGRALPLEPVGELAPKGLRQPVPAWSVALG